MNSPKCGNCGIYNFVGSTQCKRCQQPLHYQQGAAQLNMEDQLESESGHINRSTKDIFVGGLVCLVGIVVTALSYTMASSSPSGGRYVVAWGAIVFGGLQFLKGLFGSSDS